MHGPAGMYVPLFILIPSFYTSKMSADIYFASKMTLVIHLQICKASDETVVLDLKCDSQKYTNCCNLVLLVDVSSAQLHDATWCLSDRTLLMGRQE